VKLLQPIINHGDGSDLPTSLYLLKKKKIKMNGNMKEKMNERIKMKKIEM
jgi:hypothetical protein